MPKLLKDRHFESVDSIKPDEPKVNSTEGGKQPDPTMSRRDFLRLVWLLGAGAAAHRIVTTYPTVEAYKDVSHGKILLQRNRWYEIDSEAKSRRVERQPSLQEIVESLDASGVYWVPRYPYWGVLPNLADELLGGHEVKEPPVSEDSCSNLKEALSILVREVNKYPPQFFKSMFGVDWYVCLAESITIHNRPIIGVENRGGAIQADGLARIVPRRSAFFPTTYNPIIVIRIGEDMTGGARGPEYFPYVFHHEVFHAVYNINLGVGPMLDPSNPEIEEAAISYIDKAAPIIWDWYDLLPPSCESYYNKKIIVYGPQGDEKTLQPRCGYSSYADPYGMYHRIEDMAATFGWLMAGRGPEMANRGDPFLASKVDYIKDLMRKWTNGAMDQRFWLRVSDIRAE